MKDFINNKLCLQHQKSLHNLIILFKYCRNKKSSKSILKTKQLPSVLYFEVFYPLLIRQIYPINDIKNNKISQNKRMNISLVYLTDVITQN